MGLTLLYLEQSHPLWSSHHYFIAKLPKIQYSTVISLLFLQMNHLICCVNCPTSCSILAPLRYVISSYKFSPLPVVFFILTISFSISAYAMHITSVFQTILPLCILLAHFKFKHFFWQPVSSYC